MTPRAAAVLVAALTAVALAGPAIAPHHPDRQHDPAAGRFLPPGSSRVELIFSDGSVRLAETVSRTSTGWSAVRLGRSVEVATVALAADPRPIHFLLGTDGFGRDLLSRLLAGARVSLGIGVFATLIAIGAGIAVGALAAGAGGLVDAVAMRTAEALLVFPRFLLVLVASALWRLDVLALAVLLGATTWMETSRLVRAQLLAVGQSDFALAARALGLSRTRILLRHLLPNALSPVLADGALRIGDVILLEATLSFLGHGVPAPAASWGRMIADGQASLATAWWATVLPGLSIAGTVLLVAALSDALRDWCDPTLAREAG